MMKRISSCSMVVALALALPMGLVACDRTVAEKTTTHTDSNGNVSKESKTVREDPAGNVTVTKEKTDKTVDTR